MINLKRIRPRCKKCDAVIHRPKSALLVQNLCRYCTDNLRFIQGEISDRNTLRRHLIKNRGYKCESCEGEKWLEQLIPLEVDHIDGNAGDSKPNNIRLLCPNCHALMPTSKGKNRGNGRKSRGLPKH